LVTRLEALEEVLEANASHSKGRSYGTY
jgi:hypothetical protein